MVATLDGGHTSGPWFAKGNTSSISVITRTGGLITSVKFAEGHRFAAAANAYLLAAAPELLEALKDYLQAGEDCCNPEKDGAVAMVLFAKAEEACRAAIAKAEGK